MSIGDHALPGGRVGERVRLTLRYALGQHRMSRYALAGLAHKAIFFGFLVLLVRGLILFARGFAADPGFGFWILDHGTVLGNVYGLVKDVYVVLVILGALVFLYYRLVARPPATIAGLIEARGVGIVEVPHRAEAELVMIVDLAPRNEIERLPPDPLPETEILGVRIPLSRLAAFEASSPVKLKLLLGGPP